MRAEWSTEPAGGVVFVERSDVLHFGLAMLSGKQLCEAAGI